MRLFMETDPHVLTDLDIGGRLVKRQHAFHNSYRATLRVVLQPGRAVDGTDAQHRRRGKRLPGSAAVCVSGHLGFHAFTNRGNKALIDLRTHDQRTLRQQHRHMASALQHASHLCFQAHHCARLGCAQLMALLQGAHEQDRVRWVLEDEGRMIGANHLPECLRERMAQSPIAVVEDPFELRIERLREEYFTRMHHDFFAAYGEEQGWQEYSAYLHHGLFAIRRRLGLQRFAELTATLDESLAEQRRSGSTEAHFAWLVPLLNEYYDPMYRYQLEKKADKIVYRGTFEEVAGWLAR